MTRILMIFCLFAVIVTPVFAQTDTVTVTAAVETVESAGDGATGVVVWAHPIDPAQSLILGGDDNAGLGVYDLNGALVQFLDGDGGVTYPDMRYRFPLDGAPTALIAAGIADTPLVVFYTVEAETRQLIRVGALEVGVPVAAMCMAVSRITGAHYVFVISEGGAAEQYRLTSDDGEITGDLARAFSIGGEVESCMADDALGRLYVVEGDIAVWRYGVEPEDGIQRRIVDVTGTERIAEEVEGVALYQAADNQGYLLVTDEKADRILVYERTGDNAYLGAFEIGAGETTDAVSEPTGITVSNLPLGEAFPAGVFIAADDVNTDPRADNNYKLVSWADIAAGLNLQSDAAFDPRGAALSGVVSDAVAVSASAETSPVLRNTDSADDPAFWLHPTDPAQSLIIGTDKRAGLVSYSLTGESVQVVEVGRVNNVDVRQNVTLGVEVYDIAAATNRTTGTLDLFTLDRETGEISPAASFVSGVEEVYGVCLYAATDGATYAFVNSADTGEVEQYRLGATDGVLTAEVVRTFSLGSQTEGCVVDDERGVLYLGEEAVGFWRIDASPTAAVEPVSLDTTADGGNLTADVEGISLFVGADGAGYIVVSSQGSSTFVVYDRQTEAYLGTVRIAEGETTDAVSGTDGIEVVSVALPAYPNGLFIVQDDVNLDGATAVGQNFKLIDFGAILTAIGQ